MRREWELRRYEDPFLFGMVIEAIAFVGKWAYASTVLSVMVMLAIGGYGLV